MREDFGFKKELIPETDATAGRGIALRLGAGKVRHRRAQYLWAQAIYHQKHARLNKVPGDLKTAGMMTKHPSGDMMDVFMNRCGFVILEGRGELSLRAAV
eukprot:5235253-Pyramimonas_sp.AAC.1